MKTINIKFMLMLSLLLSVLYISCDKKVDNQDRESPVIEILQPTSGQTFVNGDTVHVQASISDNDQLHDITAKITRNDVEVWDLETHSHNEILDLFGWYIIEVEGANNDFVLSITASDHNGNEDTKNFEFLVVE